jgi:hypothetical protein
MTQIVMVGTEVMRCMFRDLSEERNLVVDAGDVGIVGNWPLIGKASFDKNPKSTILDSLEF